ncbi:TPA: hypothetical protein ACGUVV_004658 [Vibrio vulnificus]|uniref:hypothetical protein n=1 Tax=Vibrio vulnificus TaxID=672 RepID=UPI000CD263F3|nr:hypothetical protein [Vibrio vulnificus]POB18445.1 hypothetical protein CRN36_08825 [Vibrio vulnificus]HAS6021740.1 hypothetical protein [Vibrio vulnificus]HAS6025027.1 hypothetical protein [Vibrio vulnificus]HAS6036796.1 hypothetical protein [Vibrio vulnificus]HAS6144830.1 hypothetical protein [Vibrio vulnificus]
MSSLSAYADELIKTKWLLANEVAGHLSDVVGSLEPRHAGQTWLAIFSCNEDLYGLEHGYAQYRQSNPDHFF